MRIIIQGDYSKCSKLHVNIRVEFETFSGKPERDEYFSRWFNCPQNKISIITPKCIKMHLNHRYFNCNVTV